MSDSLRELGGDHLKGIKKTLSKSSEAQKERSERVRKSWVTSRDIRLESLPRGEEHHWKKSGHIRRHRVQFSPMQRREWKDEECAFCGGTENLVLDHILPISAGGSNERINAQTLCQPCNLWKMWFVDRPLALVVKGS
jgi:5-methylcytosine-specific restriction endonuclease McrA